MPFQKIKPSGPVWDNAVVERNWGLFKGTPRKSRPGYDKRPANPRDGYAPIKSENAFRYTLMQTRAFLRNLKSAGTNDGLYWFGYLPRPGSALIGLDFDHVLNPETGEMAEWFEPVVSAAETYSEISPSGDGVRLLVPRQSGDSGVFEANDAGYLASEGRGFTLTGAALGGVSLVASAPVARAVNADRRGQNSGRLWNAKGKVEKLRPLSELRASPDQVHLVYQILEDLPPTESYDEWVGVMYNVIGAMGYDEDAFDAFDNWSAKGGGYNPEENRMYWDRAKKNNHGIKSGFDALISRYYPHALQKIAQNRHCISWEDLK